MSQLITILKHKKTRKTFAAVKVQSGISKKKALMNARAKLKRTNLSKNISATVITLRSFNATLKKILNRKTK